VACGQVDELAHLAQVARVAVRDHEEAAAAVGVAVLRAERADARARGLVVVVVARVERADDQLAAPVDVHVLVLPVTRLRVLCG
jgi:predicted ribosome-associated RNA-binding protein Tma20